jgi:hypothetical protein
VVLLAALIATGVSYLSWSTFLRWNPANWVCNEDYLFNAGLDRVAKSYLSDFARGQNLSNNFWDVSVRVGDGRTLIFNFRLKKPVVDMTQFQKFVDLRRQQLREAYCGGDLPTLASVKATQINVYYSSEGQWLTSHAVGPIDCPQW